MKGTIFDIQHFSVHDGPGIRSTVFLKGCQLRCLWCHNPESILTRPHELSFVAATCVGCGSCFQICKKGAHRMENGVHLIDREKCIRCGDCVPECPVKALTLCGKEIEAADVIKEVVHDKSYYQEDGGMTISGGEPLIQRDFVRELVFLAKEEGLGVALETNGYYNFSLLDGIKEHVDIFLIDWKETDPQKHREYTAVPNDIIYANIKRLHDEGRRILVRCPIIPGLNDREDHFRRIAEITRELPNLIGAELLPYHNLGVSKNERFGLTGELESVSLDQPDPEVVEGWIQFTRDCGGRLINET